MTLETKLGRTVHAHLIGHGPNNGALIPGGSTNTVTSNDPAVATVDSFVIPEEGALELMNQVTILSTGVTDFHSTTTTPDGDVFESTATLVVEATAIKGLVSVELTLTEAQINPLK